MKKHQKCLLLLDTGIKYKYLKIVELRGPLKATDRNIKQHDQLVSRAMESQSGCVPQHQSGSDFQTHV